MFGFPVNLQDSGVQKFTNDADNGFPKIQQREIFYSVKDGLWNDLSVWQTASGRIGIFPTRNDDVYIKHNIDLNINAETNNVFVSGLIRSFIVGGRFLYCFGNFKCVGTFDGSIGLQLVLFQNDNYINNFIPGLSTIYYAGNIDQEIMPLPYWNLQTGIFYNNIIYGRYPVRYADGTKAGNALKSLKSNLIISNNLNVIYGKFDTRGFDLLVNGITGYYGPGQVSEFVSTGSGNLLFVGEFRIQSTGYFIGMDFSEGNPNIEFRGGIDTYRILAGAIKMGTGTITFSTNNQTIRSSAGATGNITFDGNVVLNNVNLIVDVNTSVVFNGTINATNASNTLTNKGTITFGTAASVPSMTTGIVDFTTFANTITYGGNYTATIPSYFTTFHNLTISGTGTKSLGVNTTLNGNLNVNSNGNLELSTYDFVVNGTSTLFGTTTIYPLQKSGGGNVTFGGLISSNFQCYFLDFSSGNPNVEVKGGINLNRTNNALHFRSGTGTWTFSTNNQSINDVNDGGQINFYGPILISGAISLTLGNGLQNFTMNVYDSLNGNNASSTLINKTRLYNYTNNLLMSTGVFDFTTFSTSVIGFFYAGNMNIPYTTFQGLTIGGTGIKSAIGNIICNNTLKCDGGSFELSTYDLTANAGMSNNAGILSKNGSGSVLFVGLVQTVTSGQLLDFRIGNPNVELRGGINLNRSENIGVNGFYPGDGTWTFTTNNQSLIDLSGSNNAAIFNNIVISGSITLTYAGFPLIINGTLNGDNVNSKFLIGPTTGGVGANVTYNNATQPMATGILDTSTNLNTWIYGNSNQDIKGGPTTLAKQVYRNLTLNGGGTKTLQGYVSVLNTYTLTSPATLNNNGFTLTNP